MTTRRPIDIDHDALWPRDDPGYRYRLYFRAGGRLDCPCAAPDLPGVGAAIGALVDDQATVGRTLGDLGQLGILDALRGKWIVSPWARPEIPVTYSEGDRR